MHTARFNAERMAEDMVGRGWLQVDLARHADVSHMTVSRFFSGERQTARVALKLALALGRPLSRYLVKRTTKTSAPLDQPREEVSR